MVVETHRADLFPRDLGAHWDVLAAADLADVMQQGPQRDRTSVGDGGQEFRRKWIGGRIVEQAVDPRHRAQQVPVHGEPVVRVTLRAAPDVAPPRHEPLEHADAVEDGEARNRRIASAKQREERVPRAFVPDDGVGDRRGGDGVRQRRRDRLARRRQRVEHVGGAVERRGRCRARPGHHPRKGVANHGVDRAGLPEHLAHQPVDRGQPRFVDESHRREAEFRGQDRGAARDLHPSGEIRIVLQGVEDGGVLGASEERSGVLEVRLL